VASKPPRLWAAIQQKLNQLSMLADVSAFDYLCERISYLEHEVAELRTEIAAAQPLRNVARIGLQFSGVAEPKR
jgi:hypothetical protein